MRRVTEENICYLLLASVHMCVLERAHTFKNKTSKQKKSNYNGIENLVGFLIWSGKSSLEKEWFPEF